MFNLEQAIADWRKQMLAVGIQTPVPLEELENHLREEMERQMKSGLDEAKTFDVSVQKIGQAEPLKVEFKKIDVEDWNRRLAWAAWILFAVSFFLPAYADGRGWKCAGLSATAVSWSNFSLRNWFDVHLASLTLANLMMIVSPFLLARLLRTANSLKWLRLSTFAALVLVWSFLLLLIADGGRTDLKIGCYVWAASFLLLFLSTLKSRNQETEMQKEQYV